MFPSTVHVIVPGALLSMHHFPGGSPPLQRHHQLSDRHRHCPVRGSRLLLGRLPTRVQTAAFDHEAPAWVHHTSSTLRQQAHLSYYHIIVPCPRSTCCLFLLQVLWPASPSTPVTLSWQRWTKVSSILQRFTQQSVHPHRWVSRRQNKGFCCDEMDFWLF